MTPSASNFDELISRYRCPLKAYAFNFTRNQEDANDLTQETLLKAYSYFSSFKPGTNFKGWLFTIMKNTFINSYRRTRRMQRAITTEEEVSAGNLLYGAARNHGN